MIFPERQIAVEGYGAVLQAVVCGEVSQGDCVVMCYPLFEERKHVQRAYVSLARALARRSIASIRFDYFACGNSPGRFDEATLSQWVCDTIAVMDVVAAWRPGRVMAMGLRMGANIALAAAQARETCQGLLLWNPVGDTRVYLAGEYRRNGIRDMLYSAGGPKPSAPQAHDQVHDIAGYPVGGGLIGELQSGILNVSEPPSPTERIRWGVIGSPGAMSIASMSMGGLEAIRAGGSPFWQTSDGGDFDGFVSLSVEHFAGWAD